MTWWTPTAWLSGQRKLRQNVPLAAVHERALAASGALPLLSGNRIELVHGAKSCAAMLEAIDAAHDHIHIDGCIVDADGPGEEFARRLAARCRDGVRVLLLSDSSGALRTPGSFFDALERDGALHCEYRPVHGLLARFGHQPQRRNHCKLMVVDGKVGFIGGLSGGCDAQVRVRGPVVAQLQALFIAQWNRHASPSIPAARRDATPAAAGLQRASAAPADGRRPTPYCRALLAAIDAARLRVLVSAVHVVPPRRLLRALLGAAQRGVDVQLLLPGRSQVHAPLQAGQRRYGALLRAGVGLHERHGALPNAGATVIDGVWSAVGSSPLDGRSHAEVNLLILDAPFAAEVERVFHADVAQSRPVEWQPRSPLGGIARFKQWLARRFAFLL